MTNFCVYLPSGEIVRSGDCPDELIAAQAQAEGETSLPCDSDVTWHSHMMTRDGPSLKPGSPSSHHVFNWQTKQWEDPRNLQDFRDAKWAVIKAARTAAEFGSFTYNGMVFDGDVDAQRRLSGYISVSKGALASGIPFQAAFTLADNTQVLLEAADFVGIELAKMMSVAQAFSHAVALRDQIEAATTPKEVEAVQW
jgi:hypothetical protein